MKLPARAVSERWVLHAVVIAGLLCLAILSGLLWLEWRERFPNLPPGSYMGTIHGAVSDTAAVPFFVEAAEEDLVFAVLHPDWKVRSIEKHHRSGGANEDLPPVSLPGGKESMQLIGGSSGDGRYAGIARNISSDDTGSWELTRIFGDVTPLSPGQREEVAGWLRLRAELADVEERITRATATVAEQKDQLDKLTGFVTERGKLRASADEKFQGVRDELTAARKRLADGEAQAEALVKKLDLALRVTAAGRLASLARESLEREGRWIRSVLRSEIESTTPGFQRAVERGEQIMRLKREIGYERARIRRLLEEQRRSLQPRSEEGAQG